MLENVFARVQALDCAFRKKGSIPWCRGHRKNEWLLKSTLHRYIERLTSSLSQPFEDVEQKDLLRSEEKSLYRRFKREAWPLLAPTERSVWGVIFTMQHYKLPTRLLDWTENFACALFFAQQGRQPEDTAAIWVLDSEGLNEVALGKRGLVHLDETIAQGIVNVQNWHPLFQRPTSDVETIGVSPLFTNPRMIAQRSAFTLTGDSFLPLDEQFEGRLINEGLLEKIELAPESFEEVGEYLRLTGLTAFTYFPDLEGLALDHEARTEATLRDAGKFFPGQVKK